MALLPLTGPQMNLNGLVLWGRGIAWIRVAQSAQAGLFYYHE